MTDEEAIAFAKLCVLPLVHFPPRGCIDEIITVDLRDRRRPVVTRESSAKRLPPNAS